MARERRTHPAFLNAYRRLENEANAFLSEDMQPQDRPAGYYHNYFCPDHAVELAFDANSPNAHRCPRDGRVFSGEPYDSAWRWFVNNRLSEMAYRLALLWRLDANRVYLKRCREILLAYAERYPGYPIERELPYGWGKVANHSLDEAVWLIPVTRAYDLVRETLNARERTLIETNLLALAAEHIQGQKFHRIHNIECWHNAALAAVGICLDDAGVQKALRTRACCVRSLCPATPRWSPGGRPRRRPARLGPGAGPTGPIRTQVRRLERAINGLEHNARKWPRQANRKWARQRCRCREMTATVFDERRTEQVVSSMTMPTADLIAIIGSVLGVGLTLAVLIMRTTARLDRRIDEAGADRRAFQAEAAQDRRALQASMESFRASMDTFRMEMQRLAERQSRVEGVIHDRAHGTAD